MKKPSNDDDINLIYSSPQYELWDTPNLNRDTEILVPPHMRSDFADISSKLNLKTKLIIDNLQT
jgi:hypothetical protein